MPANVETLAYRFRTATDTPWHGLGAKVTREMSVEEWQTAAGLNWTVQRRKLFMRASKEDKFPTVEVTGQHAIVRSSDGRVFAVMSDKYIPVQNRTLLEFFREYCEAGGMEIDTAGALGNGSIVWVMASIGEEFKLGMGTNGNADVVKGRVLLYNGHDGTRAFGGRLVNTRVVCSNTFGAAMGEDSPAEFRIRHNVKVDRGVIEDAQAKLGLARNNFRKLHEEVQVLTEAKVDMRGQEVLRYVAALTQPDLLGEVVEEHEYQDKVRTGETTLEDLVADYDREKAARRKRLELDDLNVAGRSILTAMLNSPGADMSTAKNTWWGAFNGVTYYTDHVARAQSQDNRLTSAWFGDRAVMKQQAYQMAVANAKGRVGA